MHCLILADPNHHLTIPLLGPAYQDAFLLRIMQHTFIYVPLTAALHMSGHWRNVLMGLQASLLQTWYVACVVRRVWHLVGHLFAGHATC